MAYFTRDPNRAAYNIVSVNMSLGDGSNDKPMRSSAFTICHPS